MVNSIFDSPVEISTFINVSDNAPKPVTTTLRDLFEVERLECHTEPSPGDFDDKPTRSEYKTKRMQWLYVPATFIESQAL